MAEHDDDKAEGAPPTGEQADESGAAASGAAAGGAAAGGAAAGGAAAGGSSEPPPAEALKQGLGLLWSAAKSTAKEIQREVEQAGVGKALHEAGRELEKAATTAAKGIEGLIGKIQPPPPTYDDRWAKKRDEPAEPAGEPEEPKGDVRIHVDDER